MNYPMKIEQCYKKIETYRARADYAPRFVDVCNVADFKAFRAHFDVGSTKVIDVASYANHDELPRLDELTHALSTAAPDALVIVTGLTCLRLLGRNTLASILKDIAARTWSSHIVVLCYQCGEALDFHDPRLDPHVYRVDGTPDRIPDVTFIAPGIELPGARRPVDGIQGIARAVERAEGRDRIYVTTKKYRSDYPDSTFRLDEVSSPYDALVSVDPCTARLDPKLGTDDRWKAAMSDIVSAGSWANLIDRKFDHVDHLERSISRWNGFNAARKWLYFIALKLYGASGCRPLDEAVRHSATPDELPGNVYRSLIDIPHDAPNFWGQYDLRKALLDGLDGRNPDLRDRETSEYVTLLAAKGPDAIYYLTDRTPREREKVFELLARYADDYDAKGGMPGVIAALEHVYPDLYNYLQPYDFSDAGISGDGAAFLTDYFRRYKLQKVTNRIDPDFLASVEAQARDRDFYHWLSPRSEKIEKLDVKRAKLFFVDAMGVEYLGYILAYCKRKGLAARVSVCCCDLPSLTCYNKDFVDAFRSAGGAVEENRELDDLKHHGQEGSESDYGTTKLPYYISKELEIISRRLGRIASQLESGAIRKAYMVSDHGASRLAVIHEAENRYEMAKKGQHSGRCCPKSDVDVQPDSATEETAGGISYWVLANYDRFRGGRKANVEVHGGASLEEVAVPIVTITLAPKSVRVSLITALPVKVSRKKPAEITFQSNTPLENVTVRVNGDRLNRTVTYDAKLCGDNLYTALMDDVKRAGDYTVTVLADGIEVAEFALEAQNAGMAINKSDIL